VSSTDPGIRTLLTALADAAWDHEAGEGIWVNEHLLSTDPELDPPEKLALARQAEDLGYVEFNMSDDPAFRLTVEGLRAVYAEPD
jgi:hypothetical protein